MRRATAKNAGIATLVAALSVAWPQPATTEDRADAASKSPPAAADVRLERIIDNPTLSRKKRGARLRRWVTGDVAADVLHRPYGLAWDGDNLLVTDPGAGRVTRINRRNRVATTPPGVFESPIGVAVCEAGIVVTDSKTGAVTVLDADLKPSTVLVEGLERPTGVTCDGDRIFVLETARHRVRVFRADGGAGEISWGRRGESAGEFNFPVAATWHDGTLWVGDTLNFRVQQLEGRSGGSLKSFGRLGDAPGEMPRIKGMALDDRGRVWVSDAHLDLVSIYAADGALLASLGAAPHNEMRFAFPAGIASHPDGRVSGCGFSQSTHPDFSCRLAIAGEGGMKRGGATRAGVLLVAFVSPAFAQHERVASTVHNLSANGPGEVRALKETEICKFCHIPHNAVTPVPLWGHALSRAQYTTPRVANGEGRMESVPQPDGSSRLCLSCHDGTVALGDIGGGASPIAMAGTARLGSGHKSSLGTDLTGSHPVSFVVRDDSRGVDSDDRDMGLRTLAVIQADKDVRLDADGRMQCTTCHDAHADRYYQEGRVPRFWVKPTVDEVCLTCHTLR